MLFKIDENLHSEVADMLWTWISQIFWLIHLRNLQAYAYDKKLKYSQ